VEVTDNDKRSSLLRNGIYYARKKIIGHALEVSQQMISFNYCQKNITNTLIKLSNTTNGPMR